MISVYGRALYALAGERGLTDVVARELSAFGQAIRRAPELETLWLRVRLPVKIKIAVFGAVLETDVSSLTRHFLTVLIRRRRESYLEAVLERFSELKRRGRGRVGARVTSAAPLSAPSRGQLQALAERLTGVRADMEYTVDPALRGGFILRAGDYLLDASLRGRLERLRLSMAAGAEVTGHGASG